MSDRSMGSRLGTYIKGKAVRRLVARVGMAKLAAAGAVVAIVLIMALAVLAMFAGGGALVSNAQAAAKCVVEGGSEEPPPKLVPIYAAAAQEYELGARGPGILAAINFVETSFGTNVATSSAGANGWMAFMPETWEAYGVDANKDGTRDPYDPEDAIFAAARYLHASGAPGDWYKAVFAYNHADWYVQKVFREEKKYGGPVVCTPATTVSIGGKALFQNVQTLTQPQEFRPLPARLWADSSSPPQSVDARVWPDAVWLLETYDMRVTAARESGHETHGDGTAMDIVPQAGKGWDETTRRAAEDLGWRESCGYSGTAPVCPLAPAIQFVGYNGYDSHGDPAHAGDNAHLHISWQSSSFGSGELSPPPAWVRVFPLA